MTVRPTFLYFISFLLYTGVYAQEPETEELTEEERVRDSVANVQVPQTYGLRVGLDLSKFVQNALDDGYEGLEIVGDFRIDDNYYLAAELGTETNLSEENTFDATIQGSYIRAGFNYNAYNNWAGMSNLIYAGVRAGFSTYSSTLNNYTIYTTNTYFEPDVRDQEIEFSGLNATWLEVQLGVQAELFNNVYLGFNVQLKRLITQKEPEGFGNIYIPGFNKVTTASQFGAGYGYTLTYLIPFFKR